MRWPDLRGRARRRLGRRRLALLPRWGPCAVLSADRLAARRTRAGGRRRRPARADCAAVGAVVLDLDRAAVVAGESLVGGVRRGARRGAAGPALRRRGPRDAAAPRRAADVARRARAGARRARRRGAGRGGRPAGARRRCRTDRRLACGARARRGARRAAGPPAPAARLVGALAVSRRRGRTGLPRPRSGARVGASARRSTPPSRRPRGRPARCSGPARCGRVTRTVRDELFGAGPLQALLDDPDVTDVLVNGPRDVWVERAGRLVRAGGRPRLGADDVRALAVRLAAAGGQRLDDASPAVDARLPDGTRLHAVLPPVAGAGALLSLRVVRSRAFTRRRAASRPARSRRALVPVVRALVATRANLLVSGATGSGKTTLLAALLSLVPHDERIVVIEEAGELAPDHPHVVRLLARQANVDGAGGVDLRELVRHALRMRPDRIVLGECRGAEVREVLTALNTGHDGGCATVHANAAADVPGAARGARRARRDVARRGRRAGRERVRRGAAPAPGRADRAAVRRRGRRGPAVRGGRARGGRRPAGRPGGRVATPGPAWPALAARLGLPVGGGVARDDASSVGLAVALAVAGVLGVARAPRRASRRRRAERRGRRGAAVRSRRSCRAGRCCGRARSCGPGPRPADAWRRALGDPAVGPGAVGRPAGRDVALGDDGRRRGAGARAAGRGGRRGGAAVRRARRTAGRRAGPDRARRWRPTRSARASAAPRSPDRGRPRRCSRGCRCSGWCSAWRSGRTRSAVVLGGRARDGGGGGRRRARCCSGGGGRRRCSPGRSAADDAPRGQRVPVRAVRRR